MGLEKPRDALTKQVTLTEVKLDLDSLSAETCRLRHARKVVHEVDRHMMASMAILEKKLSVLFAEVDRLATLETEALMTSEMTHTRARLEQQRRERQKGFLRFLSVFFFYRACRDIILIQKWAGFRNRKRQNAAVVIQNFFIKYVANDYIRLRRASAMLIQVRLQGCRAIETPPQHWWRREKKRIWMSLQRVATAVIRKFLEEMRATNPAVIGIKALKRKVHQQRVAMTLESPV